MWFFPLVVVVIVGDTLVGYLGGFAHAIFLEGPPSGFRTCYFLDLSLVEGPFKEISDPSPLLKHHQLGQGFWLEHHQLGQGFLLEHHQLGQGFLLEANQ